MDSPAVITFGIKDMERGLARCRRELKSGAVIHLVSRNRKQARHRAWICARCDPGYETERVSCNTFLKHMGQVLDVVRDTGIAVEVYDHVRQVTAFWVTWAAPGVLARQPRVLQFYVTGRTERELLREFADATAISARPA